MNDPDRRTAVVAIALGAVGLGSLVSLIAFFVVGGPLGAINDVGNGVLGLLSGALAVTSWRSAAAPRPGNDALAVSAAVLGAMVTVVGSVLVLSETTGFFLAGLVSSTGFALIGIWLLLLNRWVSIDRGQRWPRQRLTLGVIAGAVMALGIISIPGVAMGLDDMAAAPTWIRVAGVSWLGTYLLFPIWSIWLGRTLATEKRQEADTDHSSQHTEDRQPPTTP